MSRYDKYGKVSTDGRYYTTVSYPVVQLNNYDFFIVIVKSTDRLDLLAKQYFNNSKLWWIIAWVNNLSGDSVMVQPGTELYIPKEYISYVH